MGVGLNIRKAREAYGMSQTDLSKKIGVSKQTLYKYENEIVTNIPSDKIEKIAEVLRVEPGDLMGWEHEVPEYEPNMLTLIDLYSRCDEKGKAALMSLARTLAE